MSGFFIERPVFAWVIAIVIMFAGILAIKGMAVEQYPDIAPPSVTIRASYPGASARVIENSVTQVIEQSLTGIDNLRYFSGNSSDNDAVITLTFEPGTDPDIAQVQTQNKIQGALARLPIKVQQQGVFVTKSNNSFLLVVGLYSKDGSVGQQSLADLLTSEVQDAIARLNGVGNVTVFGNPNAIRIWLDPEKLRSYNMTPNDVRAAVLAQNVDVSAGQLGGLPALEGQQINAVINVQSKLHNVKEFEKVILWLNKNGSKVILRDVARVELGAQSYKRIVRYKRKPAAGLAVSLASGANALATADLVKNKMEDIKKAFPPGIEVVYPYDTTPFVRVSIEEVIKTLFEAMILVILVMRLFLGSLRATFVPTVAVPVVLLGSFAVLYLFGFTINVLTMFAVVLSIGLLVDDAIVVVENVERLINEEGLSVREATKKSMKQITPALIGIALVLSSVFVPMAFFSGSAGAIYRQFSLVIVAAMGLSVLVALILSPSLCVLVLKRAGKEEKKRFFDRIFDKIRSFFRKIADFLINKVLVAILAYLAMILLMVWVFLRLPTGFLPNEDQGLMFLLVNTPAGATAQRTLKSVAKVEDYMLNKEGRNVEDLFTVTGFSFAGAAQNTAIGFVGLKDWDLRKNKDQSVFAITGRTFGALSQLRDARGFAFFPPPIRELGNVSGFEFQLVDRGGLGHDALVKARGQILGMAAQNQKLSGVRPNGLMDVAQYKVNIDHEKLSALGLKIGEVNENLRIAFGSDYVNDFIDRGRVKRVYLQGDAPSRMMPKDVEKWYMRNNSGKMVSVGEFSSGSWIGGSPKLERFNGKSSLSIQGQPAPGISSGEAMMIIEKMASKLPKGIGLEWSGLSYEERLSGAQAPTLYAISILIVFLCLAALYESWVVPFAVILTVPIGILGAAVAARLFGINNDVYFQVALLTTVGLTAKNAILIVEFAKRLYDAGSGLVEAAIAATRIRFRPIMMTSFAFILGVSPLAFSSGAGSAAQNAIGVAVIGGMLAATVVAVVFVPVFYVLVQGFVGREIEGVDGVEY